MRASELLGMCQMMVLARNAAAAVQNGCGRTISTTKLRLSEVTENNIGGLGPTSGAQELRFKGVANSNGNEVDLVITNTSRYVPRLSDNNGLEGTVGRINLLNGEEVDLAFSFLDHDGLPVTLDYVYFTFFDIDQSKHGLDWEKITVYGADSVVTHAEDHEFSLQNTSAGELIDLVATSTHFGTSCDNVQDADNLGRVICDGVAIDQAKRAMMVGFQSISSFAIKFTTGSFSTVGRNFQFAGETAPLIDCADLRYSCLGGSVGERCLLHSCVAEPTVSLGTLVQSNLGGLGPDSGAAEIRYAGVGTTSTGMVLDLVIVNNSEYVSSNPTKNTNTDAVIGAVNVLSGKSVGLTFTFVASGTMSPMAIREFFFTFFDIDHSRDGLDWEKVSVYGVTSAATIDNPAMHVDIQETNVDGQVNVVATSEAFGLECGQAQDPNSLIPVDCSTGDIIDPASRALMVEIVDTSSFDVVFEVGPGYTYGRNFQFGGEAARLFSTCSSAQPPTPGPTAAPLYSLRAAGARCAGDAIEAVAVPDLEGCGSLCAAQAACQYFSYRADFRWCKLTATCSLSMIGAAANFDVFEMLPDPSADADGTIAMEQDGEHVTLGSLSLACSILVCGAAFVCCCCRRCRSHKRDFRTKAGIIGQTEGKTGQMLFCDMSDVADEGESGTFSDLSYEEDDGIGMSVALDVIAGESGPKDAEDGNNPAVLADVADNNSPADPAGVVMSI